MCAGPTTCVSRNVATAHRDPSPGTVGGTSKYRNQTHQPRETGPRGMTETVSGGAPQKAAGKAKAGAGLKIARVFSTPGVHPYDEITWERRDVVQTNWKTGETVFEQRGVE